MLQKAKEAYKLWHDYHAILPKTHRYSLGNRVDSLFIELIEATATAVFLSPKEKLPYVRVAIRKLDTVKILLLILWETKSLDDKKYIALSIKVDEAGRMLGGWSGQLVKSLRLAQDKQNSPAEAKEK